MDKLHVSRADNIGRETDRLSTSLSEGNGPHTD
jgi:hypothetical protein